MSDTPGVECRSRAISSVTLWPGNCPPSPGLAPWAILICNIFACEEVLHRHAEAGAGHLLDAAIGRVAVGHRPIAGRVLAPFAGVRHAAQPVHRHGQRLVGLAADRAVRHGAGIETLDDLAGRLDFLQRHGFAGHELEEPAERAELWPCSLTAGHTPA